MAEQGYIPKDLSFDEQAREKLISGISKISNAVKSTLGPQGQTVLIESQEHTQGLTVTKDGVTVAKSIFLLDPVENLAVRMMKQASEKTANTAGDGTTTAIVLTEALVMAGQKYITKDDNLIQVVREIRFEGEKLLEQIKDAAIEVTDEMLIDIATISANNDKEIGEIIAKAYKDVGRDGIVTVERSQTDKTYAEVTNGIKVDRGYTSTMFINDQRKDECILEDVKVLLCDTEITNILQIESILKPIITAGEKLLIIGNCSTNVINTLAANVQRNGLQFCNIMVPSFGYKSSELMQDIAFSVGAKYFSEKTGDDLSLIRLEDLGTADKIICGKDSTIIIKDSEITKEIQDRVDELRHQQTTLTAKHERDFVNERIASLVGGIGCIQVGAISDIEQKEKFDRVDDSVCAVRSALKEGIVAGGGLLLAKLSLQYTSGSAAHNIFRQALLAPLSQILTNAGLTVDEVYHKDVIGNSNMNYGYNVVTREYGDMFEMGVVDPAKVTSEALSNAISVATTILTTNAIITHARMHSDS
jgi:chaperonin GroEL